jgi:mannitol-specific phosphotransferase system IIBC component
MYLVEKISNLILITLEDDITEAEIEEVKIKLTKIAEMAKDDVVVSINMSEKAKQKKSMQFTLENKINELLKFCYLSGLRVYSYRCT